MSATHAKTTAGAFPGGTSNPGGKGPEGGYTDGPHTATPGVSHGFPPGLYRASPAPSVGVLTRPGDGTPATGAAPRRAGRSASIFSGVSSFVRTLPQPNRRRLTPPAP